MDEILRLMGHISSLAHMFVVIIIVVIIVIVMSLDKLFAGLLLFEGDGAATGYNVVCSVIRRSVVVVDDDSAAQDGPLAPEQVLVKLILAEVLRSVVVGGDVVDPAHVGLMLVSCVAPDVAMDPRVELKRSVCSCALHAQDAHLLDLEPVGVVRLRVGQGALHRGRLVLLLAERNGATQTAPIGLFDLALCRDLEPFLLLEDGVRVHKLVERD